MITQPKHSKTLNRQELSTEGQSRRDEMLPELVGAMTELHARRQNRRRLLKLSSVLLVLFSSMFWMVSQSMNRRNESTPNASAENIDGGSIPDSDQNVRSKKGVKSNSSGSMPPYESKSEPPAKKKTLVEKYVVSTNNIEARQMESIDDEEILELLKQAGVQGWIAEIGDERVVLDIDGKRL